MVKAETTDLAIDALFNMLGIDKATATADSLLPLVARCDRVDDGWEIDLLYGEEYSFDVGDDGSCELLGYTCSISKAANWFFPDNRFNPPDGHPPAMHL